jgi:transcriptional regulator with XRE-family HTH domain
MSESLGVRLRHERERRQIALASIAENTKITVGLLEGLEKDDVSRWPSGIFRRSFVRSYAQSIGLDPDPIVREFLERHPDPEIVPIETIPPASASPNPAASALRRTLSSMSLRSLVIKVSIITDRSAFARGTFIPDVRRRWAAIGCDLGVLSIVALALSFVLGHFWTLFGVSTLCYYVGSILILGNTPGVCLFAPDPRRKQ